MFSFRHHIDRYVSYLVGFLKKRLCEFKMRAFHVAGNDFIRCQDESTRKILQDQIVDALRSGERHGASALLSKLTHGNNSLSSDDFHGILKYCARSPDPVVS